MNSSILPTIQTGGITRKKHLYLWLNFMYKRKLIKNLLLTIKNNVQARCKGNEINLDNLSANLSKIFAKLDIPQLQMFLEIAQIVCQFGSSSPFTDCIENSGSLFRTFDIDYILKILWMSFRFTIYTEHGNINVVKICSNQLNCINPFHCSLMKNVVRLNSQPRQPRNHFCILRSICCRLQINGQYLTTKITTPNFPHLSSVFVIYYNLSTENESDRFNDFVWHDLGICFYQANNQFLFLYNFSNQTIFISSICMELKNFTFSANEIDPYVPVHKLLPDQSIRVFSFDHLETLTHVSIPIPILNSGIVTIQISFGKGWGKGYSRSSFIYCPKRCEVSLKLPEEK